MQWADIAYQLGDLPDTYKRSGPTYEWVMNSLTAALDRYTNSSNAVVSMANFTNAQGKWLDFWGQLLGGISRLNEQTDEEYMALITQTILDGKGPPVAILDYVKLIYGIKASITENFPNVGWYLKFGSSFPQSEYNQLALTLGNVRPAGVPFTPFYVLGGGLYLNTINYLGRDRVTGSYIGQPVTAFNFTIPNSTPNVVSELPTLFLSDPTINPGIPQPVAPTQVSVNPTGTQALGSDAYSNFTMGSSSPNGSVAGALNDKYFSTNSSVLYICTTAGTATTAIWTPVTGTVS